MKDFRHYKTEIPPRDQQQKEAELGTMKSTFLTLALTLTILLVAFLGVDAGRRRDRKVALLTMLSRHGFDFL